MAKVNFNNLDDESMNVGNGGPGSDVGFFTLKNDNDEAVVRFMCKTTDDFEILTVHEVSVGNRYQKINCIRDPREPLENCPLCASGAKISNRFFIKLIQYETVMENGIQKVVPKAMMWERSTQYAKTLKSYIDNYGPLDDVICKIIRHGKAGDMQTTYEIVPNLSKNVYPDNIYVKDENIFGTFNAFGTIVRDKSYEEMTQYLVTGEFPARQPQQQAAPNTNVAPATSIPPTVNPVQYAAPQPQTVPQMPGIDTGAPAYNPVPQGGYVPPTVTTPNVTPAPQFAPQPQFGQVQGGFIPADNGAAIERPRRY